MGACDCVAKLIIVLVNVIFMILGLVLAAAGGVLIGGQALLSPFLEPLLDGIDSVSSQANLNSTTVIDTAESVAAILKTFETAAIALIVAGLVILAITILGMCGSCCSVKVMLIAYVVIVLVLFLVHLSLFVCLMMGVFGDEIKGALVTALENGYAGITGTSVDSLLWNYIMIRYKCCGVNNYLDFENAKKWDNQQTFTYSGVSMTYTMITPIACCVTNGDFPSVTPVDDTCSYAPNDLNNNWKTSCWKEIDAQTIQPNIDIVIGVNCGILALELILAVLTIIVLVLKDKAKILPV